MKKRILAMLLTIAMMVSMLSTTASAATTFADDTGKGAWKWASTYIYACQEAGIISGFTDGTFRPSANLTRAQAATIIANALQLEEGDVATRFSDVKSGSWYAKYVNLCASNGIISGYTDGTFRPGQNVTRAEFCTMLARALGLETSGQACFKDDTGTGVWKWASTYIYACYDAGAVSGYTDGTFRGSGNITRAEAATMISRAMGIVEVEETSQEKQEALELAKAIYNVYYISFDSLVEILTETYGYSNDVAVYAAINCGVDWNEEALGVTCALLEQYFLSYTMLVSILEDEYLFTSAQATYAAKNCGADWNEQAYQGAVYYSTQLIYYGYTPTKELLIEILVEDEYFTTAQATYAAEKVYAELYGTDDTTSGTMIQMTIDGVTYSIGQSASVLPTPDETLASVFNLTWYVFGTDTYENFFVAGVSGNKIVALVSAGSGFTYQGMCCGSTLGDYSSGTYNGTSYLVGIATDNNDSGIVHAALVMLSSYASYTNLTASAYAGEAKLNFHLVNAFRVFHFRDALTWSSSAATTALLHSQDMATNNYFSHTGLDSSSVGTRLTAQGVSWTAAGENIAAGYGNGFDAYNGWVNSSGHRSNMLSTSYTHMGAGLARNTSSDYIYYFTQVFYA